MKPCQKRTNQTIQLLINGLKIDYYVKETFFFGVIIDKNLNLKSEIWNLNNLANKVLNP